LVAMTARFPITSAVYASARAACSPVSYAEAVAKMVRTTPSRPAPCRNPVRSVPGVRSGASRRRGSRDPGLLGLRLEHQRARGIDASCDENAARPCDGAPELVRLRENVRRHHPRRATHHADL
jgi:hypothetical protein